MNRKEQAEEIDSLLADDLWSCDDLERKAIAAGAQALRTLDELEEWATRSLEIIGNSDNPILSVQADTYRGLLHKLRGDRPQPGGEK